MRRVLALLFALLFGAGQGCVYYYPNTKDTGPVLEERVEVRKPRKVLPKEFYENISYKEFDKVDFDSFPKEKIKLPKDFEENAFALQSKCTGQKYEDEQRFKEEVLALAKEHLEDISNAPASKCIDAAMRIVMDKLEYEEVDATRKDLRNQWKIDLYFYEGVGDCDKYSSLLCEVFNIIKRKNKNCKNIYITENIGGNFYTDEKHAWNSIWMVDENGITMTFADITGEKEFVIKEAWIDRTRMFLADKMKDCKNAVDFLNREYKEATSDYLKDLIWRKAHWNSLLYIQTNNKKYLKDIIDAVQDAKGMYMRGDKYQIVLMEGIKAYRALAEHKKADELVEEYKEKYPKQLKFIPK